MAKIINELPRKEADAVTTKELSKIFKMSQSTMYRLLSPLFRWDNLGQFTKETLGAPEWHYYLKSNFTISFRRGSIKIILDNNQCDSARN